MENPTRLRAALVGAGHISAQHAPAWVASPDADLVAICDVDRARAEARRAQVRALGGPEPALYTDIDAMLAEVRPDCVDLATRPETHHALIARAVKASAHVLCQKPLAPTLAEAQGMADLANAAGARFMVTEMWRFLPWFRDLGRLLAAQTIGSPHYLRIVGPRNPMHRERPVHPNQPYFADMPKLIVYEMYIHWIDAARYLLGDVASVYARAARVNPAIRGEDWALVVLGHQNRATSLLESSWATPTDTPEIRREGDILVEGETGALHLDPRSLELRLIRPSGVEVLQRYDSLDAAFQSAFNACIGHFAAAVRHGQPFESSVADNLKTLAATLAAYESIEKGQAIMV